MLGFPPGRAPHLPAGGPFLAFAPSAAAWPRARNSGESFVRETIYAFAEPGLVAQDVKMRSLSPAWERQIDLVADFPGTDLIPA